MPLVLASVLFIGLAAWSFLLAKGRNLLPFPDPGSRFFSAASAEAKDAIVALLAEHGVRERFRFDTGGVLRSIMWDGTIINHSSAEVARKLGAATSSIGLIAEDPEASARHAAEFLHARGLKATMSSTRSPGFRLHSWQAMRWRARSSLPQARDPPAPAPTGSKARPLRSND